MINHERTEVERHRQEQLDLLNRHIKDTQQDLTLALEEGNINVVDNIKLKLQALNKERLLQESSIRQLQDMFGGEQRRHETR